MIAQSKLRAGQTANEKWVMDLNLILSSRNPICMHWASKWFALSKKYCLLARSPGMQWLKTLEHVRSWSPLKRILMNEVGSILIIQNADAYTRHPISIC